MTTKTKPGLEPIHKYYRGKWKEITANIENSMEKDKYNTSDYCLKDLDQKSIIELEELICRQEKILNNKTFLSKLNDKGEKVRERYNQLQNALKVAKENVSSSEQINKSTEKDVNYLEWSGNSSEEPKGSEQRPKLTQSVKEETEEEVNPLQLLARHSVEYPIKPPSRNEEEEEEDAVTAIHRELEQLRIRDEAETHSPKPQEKKDNSNYFKERFTLNQNDTNRIGKKKEPFKPNRPLRKDSCEKSHSTTINANPAQLIPIEESLKLVNESLRKEKFKMTSETEEALGATNSMYHSEGPEIYRNYRDTNESQHILDEFVDDDFYSQSFSPEED